MASKQRFLKTGFLAYILNISVFFTLNSGHNMWCTFYIFNDG